MSASILPLSARDLRFTIGGAEVIKGISLDLEEGARTIVLGPNGAGKSVLMRLLHGLLIPSAGALRWRATAANANGKVAANAHAKPDAAADTYREEDVKRHQAMVFQRPVMLRRSALANVRFALDVAGADARANANAIANADADARSREALERVGLAHLAERPARVLSGGEQQRLALARAWALKPQVLFLDEPTASLDPAATRAIEEIIAAMHAAGTAIVMTTHDIGQAKRLAKDVLFLHQGRLMEATPAAEFFHQPRSAEAAAFIRGELLW